MKGILHQKNLCLKNSTTTLLEHLESVSDSVVLECQSLPVSLAQYQAHSSAKLDADTQISALRFSQLD